MRAALLLIGINHARHNALSLFRFRSHDKQSLIRRANKMHPPRSSSFFFGGKENQESTAPWACDSPASKLSTSHDNRTEPYRIEMVNSKRRSLDVKVFRGFSMTPEEFMWKLIHPIVNETTHNRGSCETFAAISEDDAVNLLMPDYDELGRYIRCQSMQSNAQEVYFVAVYCSGNETLRNGAEDANIKMDPALFDRTNGVIGVVSAQQRDSSPLVPDSSIDDTEQQTANLELDIPFPHIYLASMRVHQSFRRTGIGRALLSSVVDYAKPFSPGKHVQIGTHLPIVLSVDNDNSGAVSMYEKFGFEYLEKNDIFSTMVFWT